jgi:hypothetical protein
MVELPVESITNSTGKDSFINPDAKRFPNKAFLSMDDVLQYIQLVSSHHDGVKSICPQSPWLFTHSNDVATLQKHFLKAIGDETNEFLCFSYATMVCHLGQYLDNGFPWVPGRLVSCDSDSETPVSSSLTVLHSISISISSKPPPNTSSESGSKLVKIFAKNP